MTPRAHPNPLALPLDTSFKATAAVVAASFALLLWRTRTAGRPAHLLAVFLLLIAANQGAEVGRALATDADTRDTWFRLATVAAALDPAALVWFASSLGDARIFRRTSVLAGFVATSGGFALYAAFLLPPHVVKTPFDALLTGYTAATYLALAMAYVRPALSGRPFGGASLLLSAYTFAAIPRAGLIGGPIVERAFAFPDEVFRTTSSVALFLDVLFLAVAIAALLWVGRRELRDANARGRMAGILGGAIALWGVLNLYHIVRSVVYIWGLPDPVDLRVFGQAAAPARWLIFCGLVSVALTRTDAFASTLRERRRAARVLIALGVLAASSLALAATSAQLRTIDVVIVAAVLVLSQGARHMVDVLAWRIYGVPMPGDRVARHEAYRRAATQASTAGRRGSRDPALQTLREELDLDEGTAAAIERAVEFDNDVRLADGQLVTGRYRVQRLLGRGGGGRTFLADDEMLERQVAIKEIEFDTPADQAAAFAEARHAARVRSDRVVAIHDIIQRPRSLLIVAELVDGRPLAELDAALPPEEARRVVGAIIEGVAAIHAAGVVHADIAPGNVVLGRTGEVKLVDFGIARAPSVTAPLASSPAVLRGTRGYVAPEVAAGNAPGFRADVFAVGVLAREIAPSLADHEVIRRAVSIDPAARWRDASEMLDAWRQERGIQVQ